MQHNLQIDWQNIFQEETIDLRELEQPFSSGEIKDAIFSMPKNKYLVLTISLPSFSKQFWFVIKGDLCKLFNAIHLNEIGLERFNY